MTFTFRKVATYGANRYVSRIRIRRDSLANWMNVDPILVDGELAIESDMGKIKIGDGSSRWCGLPYATPDEVYALILEPLDE